MSQTLLHRCLRGGSSLISVALHPVGKLISRRLASLREPARLDRGFVLILPGIEGESLLNHDIALGLVDGAIDLGIEILDWTTGWFLLAPFHLRSRWWHRRQARAIADRIGRYLREYPGRPVHLIGHSGGGAMAILALEQLPAGVQVESAVLLAAAISPRHDLSAGLTHIRQGLWNFSSRGDWLFVTVGTLLFGNLDGRHEVCAGASGFALAERSATSTALEESRLHEVPWRPRMAASFHWGGHFGCVNRLFVAEYIAPVLRGGRPAT